MKFRQWYIVVHSILSRMFFFIFLLRQILSDWYRFEILKTLLLGKCIWIWFLLWKWIKWIFVLTICIKKMPGVRFGKSTRISMISNSVTHLRSYTNSAIADIAGNSTPISPVTPPERQRFCIERQRLHIEQRRVRIEWPPPDRRRPCSKRRRLHIKRWYRRIKWWVFQNVLTVFHYVLLVVHNVLFFFHNVFFFFFNNKQKLYAGIYTYRPYPVLENKQLSVWDLGLL